MYKLTWTSTFTRTAKKFISRHPQLKKTLAQIFHDLEDDPFQPHLRLHRLQGKLKDLYAVSVTYHFRIILTLEIHNKNILLLDIGSHDDVYD